METNKPVCGTSRIGSREENHWANNRSPSDATKFAIIACNTRAISIYDAGIERPVEVFVIATQIPQSDCILVP